MMQLSQVETRLFFSRREFVKTLAVTGAGAVAALPALAQDSGPNAAKRTIKLGLDNFSVRAMGWNAEQLIDYATSLNTDSLFITDLRPFANFSESYLKDLRAKATDKALQIHL